MKGTAAVLWCIYAVTGLPLAVFGYSFTGGGLPTFTLLDDWSNPILVLIWALGAFVVFILPALALAATGWAVVEKLRTTGESEEA